MEEKMVWVIANIPHTALEDTKEHLCPVLWCSWGGWLLIMKRTEPVDRENWKPIENLFKVCGDHKPGNYGMLDGRQVMVDYGGGPNQQWQ